MSKVQFKKTLLGKEVAVYTCPHCKSSLNSPIDEVGLRDTCPSCQKAFIVPGTTELEARKREHKEKIEQERIAQHEIRMLRIAQITERLFSQYIFEKHPYVTEEDITNLKRIMSHNINYLVQSQVTQKLE